MMKELDKIANSTICALIDEYVKKPAYREILKDRLCEGMTFDLLAEKHNYSVRQVKRIVYAGEEKLFSKIPI